ncbi:MAG: hypothetical protein AAF682_25900 [Planctomycetota bacterium]
MRNQPNRNLRAAVAVALAAVAWQSPAAALGKGDTELEWKGKTTALDELPEALEGDARTALAEWGPWAEERGYSLALSDDQRVLFLHELKGRTLKKRLATIEDTLAFADRLLPLPPRDEARPRPASAGSWSWSNDGPPLESGTIVLFQTRAQADTSAVLDSAVREHPYLASFAAGARGLPGFLLQRPLCAAWTNGGPGQEEWSAENELIHRLSQLLMLRRFGPQPGWISMGFGWFAESELADSIYCFPYREGFVFATEHDGWDTELKRTFKKRDEVPFDELAGWVRGTYDPEAAQLAWGLVRFLAEHRPEALSPSLEQLRQLRDEKGIVRHGDGTWERVPNFQVSAEDQRAVFESQAGDDVFPELLRFFQKGKGYRPPKR